MTTQVTTNNSMKPRQNAPSVNVLPPAVGKLKVGFSTAIGQFDCIIDTLTNVNAAPTDEEGFTGLGGGRSAVVSLLKREHGCDR